MTRFSIRAADCANGFSICPDSHPDYFPIMKLVEIQEAILGLPAKEQDLLRLWLDEAPLDLERDSPELEAELLKAVRGPHSPYSSQEMRTACERAVRVNRPA